MRMVTKAVATSVLLTGVGYGFFWMNNKWVQENRYLYHKCGGGGHVLSASERDLPEGEKVIRIVHLSDLQQDELGRNNRYLISKVSRLKPDIILFTGDLLYRKTHNHEPAIKIMESLVSIAPVYFCLGNHETAFPSDELQTVINRLKTIGVYTIIDQVVKLAKRGTIFYVAGLNQRWVNVKGKNRSKRNKDVDMAALNFAIDGISPENSESKYWEGNLRPNEISILMAHEPQFIENYGRGGFDLIFTGHAHGGQIRLPGIGGVYSPGQGFFPELAEGVRRIGKSYMFISRGLGNSSFPIRFCNRPQIITVDILLD